MMNLKTDYKSIIKETSILTVGVAIIAAAVYFFLVPSHASVSSISGLGIVLSNFYSLTIVGDYNDFECGVADYRIFHLWERVWGENSIYQCDAPTVSGRV